MHQQKNHKGLEINKSTRFLARQLRLKNQRVIFFLGAGVSSASGLPLGNSLRDKLSMELYREYPSFKQKEKFRESFYPKLPKEQEITLEMVLQQLGQRMGYESIRDFLKPIFNKGKEPSLSHGLIAALAEKEFISLILTTNLDNLLEEALQRKKVSFRVISSRVDSIDQYLNENGNKKVIIWKLHGDLEEPRTLAVTEQDVMHFSLKKKNVLCWIFQNYNIVFVGYSMRDPDIMEVINEVTPENKNYSFFWVGPTTFNQTSKKIQDAIRKFNLSGNYIQMFSDEFFNELNYLLDLSPPAIIWKGDEAKVLRGGFRSEGDPWNRDCPSYTRIFGAAPTQENYTEWEGAIIQLQTILREPLKLKIRCKGASLRIEIPPIDGKGIHGRENGKVLLYLITKGGKLKLSELKCVKKGYLETYWPHDDRYRGIYPEFILASKH